MLHLTHLYRAPWKGALSQRVRIPPGNCRSSRQQSERMMEPASIKDFDSVPSCPASPRMVSRGRRLPCVWMSLPPVFVDGPAHPAIRPCPPHPGAAMAHPCPREYISRSGSAILRIAQLLRHLGVGVQAMPAAPHRIPTGCLVSQSVEVASDDAATGRLPHARQNSAGTKAAPEQSS